MIAPNQAKEFKMKISEIINTGINYRIVLKHIRHGGR